MRYCSFLAIGRVGYRERHEDVTKRLAQKGLTRLVWIDAKAPDISSTMIRQRLSRGESIDGLVPRTVVDYMRQRDLYRR